jgi:hypothetical protein
MVVFLQERLRALWALVWKFAGQVQTQASQPQTAGGTGSAPGTGSPADVVSNLWKAYGPSLVAGLARANASPPSSQNVTPQSQSTPPVSGPAAPPYTRSPYSASGED